MAPALRRLPLEPALLVTLPATVLAVACSASWSVGLRSVAHPFRAAGLLLLVVLSVAFAVSRGGPLRMDRFVLVAAGGFLAVAGASATWSVDPRHTLVRIAAFAALILVAAALASAYARDSAGLRRLVGALVAGGVAVALVGVAIAVVSPDSAMQGATATTGARFRGVGQNPNTTAMLFAAALPLALLLAVEARRRPVQLAAVAAVALLAGSIAASGSRGAVAAAGFGALVFCLAAATRPIPRAAAVVAVIVFALAPSATRTIAAPLSAAEAGRASHPRGSPEPPTPNDAEYVIRLEDEIGYSGGVGSSGRSWFSASGRLDAWRGALEQAEDRPVAGYGFGTEESVFVDRYQAFQGGVPENSFIGLLLQLGAVGVAAFLALGVALVAAAVRLVRLDRRLGAACLGVIGAGVVLALVQSYLGVVGNTATLTVWVCAFLATARKT